MLLKKNIIHDLLKESLKNLIVPSKRKIEHKIIKKKQYTKIIKIK